LVYQNFKGRNLVIIDISGFLQEQPTTITEYDEKLIWQLIEKAMVYVDKSRSNSSPA
jgi:hypothetical protein